jgi:hypothetical protein
MTAFMALISFQQIASAGEILVSKDTIICHIDGRRLFKRPTVTSLINDEFCLEKYRMATQDGSMEFSQRANESISSKLGINEGIVWELKDLYNVKDFENVFILIFQDLRFAHDFIEVIYCKSNDRFYIYPDMGLKTLNEILSPLKAKYRDEKELMDSNLIDSYNILRYSRFFSILKNISYDIKFPTSMNELFMAAFYKPVTIVSLADSIYYRNVELHLPIIRQDKNEIFINFNMVKDNRIYGVEIKFKNRIIVDYAEEEIGEIPNWYLGIE